MSPAEESIDVQVTDLLDDASAVEAAADVALREELLACERAAQMLFARQGQVMVEIGRRARAADAAEAETNGNDLWSRQCREEFVPDEIATLLAITRVAASSRYDTACRAADLPALQRAWRKGQLDTRKANEIALATADLRAAEGATDDETDDAVHHLVIAGVQYALTHTAPQLREWLRRQVIAANPAAAEERRQRALADRRVVITPRDDGMSELWALLPSVDAHMIQSALSKAAHEAGAGDARTMDQRRADALVDLLLGRADPPGVNLHVIVPADTLTGSSPAPGWIPGEGPITADQVHELIASGTEPGGTADPGSGQNGHRGTNLGDEVTFRRMLTDPATGVLTDLAERRYRPSVALDRAVRARDVTCRFPGCRRSADSTGTDLDHTNPWPTGATAATNLAVLCRRHHRLKHTAGWTVTLNPTGVMTWTSPAGHTHTTEPWHYTDPDPPPRE